MIQTKENREVKNSVFIDLFCYDRTAEDNVISLYNALHGETLPEGTRVEWMQLDNVIYMTLRNDVAFQVDGKTMIFAEHQSTINENMPLRSFLYAGRAYEQLVPDRGRYRKKRIALPYPEFYTFYNGKEKYIKETILRLSDSYEQDRNTEAMLELIVRVININLEEQHEILEKCPILKEYSQLMAMIRDNQCQGKKDAYKIAIRECISQGILKEYLQRKGSEVCNMLIADYNYELDMEVQREEAREEGFEEGRMAGMEKGMAEGRVEGIREGIREGRQEGRQEGRKEMILKVYSDGKTIAEIANFLGEPVEEIEKIINSCERRR